jgi:hypothetical protein
MSLGTYGGLKDSIADWSTYSDLTTQIPDFVTWAHQEICRRLRANVMLASADLTLSAETISQPTGFLGFKRLYLDTTPRRRIFTTSAESAMDLGTQFAASSYPTHVATEGTVLRFAPPFTATTTVGKGLYYKEPVALSADSDTNVVLTKYPYLYLFGSLEALHAFKEDEEMAASFGGKFGALLDDINNRDAADTMSGPLVSMPAPGGVV